MDDPRWNPRYINYARVHGKSPDEMLNADFEDWEGPRMWRFVWWMKEQKQLFFEAHPEAFFHAFADEKPTSHYLSDHVAWDAWLDAVPVIRTL